MADGSYKIRIGSEADVRGIREAEKALDQAGEAAQQFVDTLRLGVGIDLGGRLVHSVAAIPGILRDATREGIALNAQLQDGARSLATLLGQFDSASPERFADRVAIAREAIEELREKGLLAEGTFADLFAALTQSAGSAFAGGIGDLSRQIDLIVAASQVLGVMGGDQARLGQQLNQILSGNIDPANRLNQVLRLTNKEVKELIAEGALFDEIMRRFGPTLRDAEQGLDSFTSQQVLLNEQIDNLKTTLARPVFEALTEGLQELNELLEDPQVEQAIESLGFQIRGVVKVGMELTQWAVKNADSMLLAANSAGALAVALAAIKVKDLILGLGAMALGHGRSTAAIAAQTAALNANTAAMNANAAAAGKNTAAQSAQAGGRRGGFLGRPTGMGLANAAITGVAIGYSLQMDRAARLEAEAAQSQALGAEISRMGNGYAEIARTLSSIEERDEAIRSIDEDIAALRERIAGASDADAETLDLSIRQLGRMKTLLESVSDERIKQNAAEKERLAAAREAEQIEAALADYRAKRHEELTKRGLQRTVDFALESGAKAAGRGEESDAIRVLIDFLKAERAKLDKETPQTPQEAEARDTRRDTLTQLIERAAAAEEKRVEDLAAKVKDTAEQAHRDRLAEIEAEGALRLAQAERIEGSELEKARRRKQIEDDIARQKKQVEDELARLQEESDTARRARQLQYDAERIQRANALASLEAERKKEEKRSEWDRGFRGVSGRSIDARSQRHRDTLGRLIMEKGEAVSQLSYLDQFRAETEQRRLAGLPGSGASISQLLPPAQAPQARQAGQPGDQTAKSLQSMGGDMGKVASAAKSASENLRQKSEQAVQALHSIPKSIEAIAEPIARVARSAADAIEKVNRRVDDLEERLRNAADSP